MRKTIIFLLAFVSILLNVSAQAPIQTITDHKAGRSTTGQSQEIKRFPIKVTISAKVYRPKRDCKRGLGLCDITISVTPGYVKAVGILYDNNDLEIEFQNDLHPFFPPEDDLNVLQIDSDEIISLSPQVAEAFGKRSITVLPGSYSVDYGSSAFGKVTLQTRVD
ncbi:MAG TPA: hypothetical protein VGD35_19785 [Chitinophaga sp.]